MKKNKRYYIQFKKFGNWWDVIYYDSKLEAKIVLKNFKKADKEHYRLIKKGVN